MRTFLSAFLSATLATLSFGGEDKPVEAPAPSPMTKATGAVTIDGALDEPFWKDCAAIRCDFINTKPGQQSEQPRMVVKYAWDEHFLYIGYETFDANLSAKGKGVKDGAEKNQREGCEIAGAKEEKIDVVEFFISFGDENFFWEIHHNALNQFNDIWITTVNPAWPISKSSLPMYGIFFYDKEFIKDDGEKTTAMAVKLKPRADGTPSTVNSSADTDSGYTAELRLPWGGLGAPQAARPDERKKLTEWKMENQQLMLLAVVQDGDLPERYHHSAPNRKNDWFHKTPAAWPRYVLSKGAAAEPAKKAALDLNDLSAEALAAEILRRLDNKESVAELVQAASDHGMAMARALSGELNRGSTARQEALMNIVALAARCRQSHGELLKHYDPPAYETFYGPNARAEQERYAGALKSAVWPRQSASALIQAAPLPLLEWMSAQAASDKPDLPKLLSVWNQWGSNIVFRHERQHVPAVRALVGRFAQNAHILSNPNALGALVRFAGESGASEAVEFVLKALEHPQISVRAEACRALPRLATTFPDAMLRAAGKESDGTVLLMFGEALQGWPTDARAGEAALTLFERAPSADVRRAVLFSAIDAKWPQRTDLLARAFAMPGDGVLGVALQAIAEKPVPALNAKTTELMSELPEPPAPLIDALGAAGDVKAAPYLARTLKESKNLAISLKLALALEKIGGAEAHAALLAELKSATQPLLAQHLAGIAGRVKLAGSEETLISLAEDTTAPLPVRLQSIAALGAFPTESVRASLQKIDASPEKFFGANDAAATPSSQSELVEQARMLVKLALLQHGDAKAADAALELFRRGTPTTQITLLMMLARLKRDHPAVAEGLASQEFAVLLASVHAAGAADALKYRERLTALKRAPFVRAILESGLNSNGLDAALDAALSTEKGG